MDHTIHVGLHSSNVIASAGMVYCFSHGRSGAHAVSIRFLSPTLFFLLSWIDNGYHTKGVALNAIEYETSRVRACAM